MEIAVDGRDRSHQTKQAKLHIFFPDSNVFPLLRYFQRLGGKIGSWGINCGAKAIQPLVFGFFDRS